MQEEQYIQRAYGKLVGAGGKFPGITDEVYDMNLSDWLKRNKYSESEFYLNPDIKEAFHEQLLKDLSPKNQEMNNTQYLPKYRGVNFIQPVKK
jgi:hypothetical protein